MNKMKQRKNDGVTKDFYWMYGKHTVVSALSNPHRYFEKIIVTEKNFQNLKTLLEKHIKITEIYQKDDDISKKLISVAKLSGVNHQGIACLVKKIEQPSLHDVLERDLVSYNNNENEKTRVILILDKISDPQNIGAIIRSCAAFGVSTVITTKDNAPEETAAITKVSAGGFESVNYIQIANITHAIQELQKHGYWVFGLDIDAVDNLASIKKKKYKNIALVLGAEDKGISPLIKSRCDGLVKIEMIGVQKNGTLDSLNVSNAAAVAIYGIISND